MDDAGQSEASVAWSLSVFHTAALVVGLLTLFYSLGGIKEALSGLSTLEGLLLFLGLWFSTWFSTRHALRGIQLPPFKAKRWMLIVRSLIWGGNNGLLFLVTLSVVLALRLGIGSLALLTFGSFVAWPIGAIVGLVMSCLDLALIELANWLLHLCIARAD